MFKIPRLKSTKKITKFPKPKKVAEEYTFQPKVIEAKWIVDPIQEAELREEMAKNPLFAEAILRPRTDLLIKMIQEKVRYREHIGIEIKGQTRCLSRDTEIYTIEEDKVITQKLSDLNRKEDIKILSYNFMAKKIETDIARILNSGKKKIYKVTTEMGKNIYASEEHRFFILNGSKILVKRLKELRKGDELISLPLKRGKGKNIDKVKSIEYIGEDNCLDLYVEKNHNFILGSGIVVHNSGKSSVGIALCKFISELTGVPFTLKHICPNEIIYLQKLRDPNLPNGSVFLIDEQSLSIEETIMTDVGNIQLKDIKEGQIVNVLSFNFEKNKLEFVPAKKVRNKEKPTYKIKTKGGKVVEATEDHIFFVEVNGKIIKKRLKELKEGDKLICL